MTDNTNIDTVQDGIPTPQEAGRTFTQDDVNRIVQERLAKVKADPDIAQRLQAIEQREKELTAKETAFQQEQILRDNGVKDPEEIILYGIRVNQLVTEGKTFEQVAKEYFTEHPRPNKIPATVMFDGGSKPPAFTLPGSGSGMYHHDPVREGMGLNRKE